LGVGVRPKAARVERGIFVLLATAKLNDVEPFAYLKDVLERLSNGYPMSRLDDLLPWNWASPVAAAA
jgi:hypothetical protein